MQQRKAYDSTTSASAFVQFHRFKGHRWCTDDIDLAIIEHAAKRIYVRLNGLHTMPLCDGELAMIMLQHCNFFACHFCDGIKVTILEHQIGCA